MSFLTFYHNELGELSYQMECGKMYLINSGIRHDALNAAFDERVHLVLSLDGQQDLFSYVGTQGFAYELPKKPQSWRY